MKEKIGPTGQYPDGKLMDDDEGELTIAVWHKDKNVVISFGTHVSWIALPPDEAIRLGETIITRAKEIKGREEN